MQSSYHPSAFGIQELCLSDMVLPLIRGLAPIAPIAWIPLGIVLFGLGNPTAVFVVFMGVYFILTISTVTAVKAVDQRLIKTGRSFGASKSQVWTRVIFPAVLPEVFTCCGSISSPPGWPCSQRRWWGSRTGSA